MKHARKVSRIGNLAHVFALFIAVLFAASSASGPADHGDTLLAVSDADTGRETIATGAEAFWWCDQAECS